MTPFEYQIPDPTRPLETDGIGPSGELVPFDPASLEPGQVVGRTVTKLSACVGSYGMGGPGFFGLLLDNHDWLVIAMWGAAEWMQVNGRPIQDTFGDEYGRPAAWMHEGVDELSARLVGRLISLLDVRQHELRITFSNDDVMQIEESPEHRPLFEGNKQPRAFSAEDDLRRSVFLCPTDELWI